VPLSRILLYVGTAGALSIIGRSVILGPVPPLVATLAFAAYVALIGAGVAFLRLAMFVDVAVRGPRGARGVALTFDDGPSPEHTPKILDMLDEAGAKATFFVIGRKALAHPEIVRDMVARGHAVGIHGHTHDRLLSLRTPETVSDDLAEAITTVEAITGARPTFFRPPVGLTSPRIARALEWFDLTVVGWSARGLDGWPTAEPAKVAARIVPRLADGAIVLLHDAAERDDFVPASLAALPRILAAMRARDLEGVRLDAWLGPATSATSPRRAPGARPA
jgi:peptidoglycan/xylan/chitin deacetylase (PgdA/CDA1 family)